jgi:hypothetical protein
VVPGIALRAADGANISFQLSTGIAAQRGFRLDNPQGRSRGLSQHIDLALGIAVSNHQRQGWVADVVQFANCDASPPEPA